MDKYYVLVAGSGASSRANIEALIEDHVYANGPDVTFVLPFKEKISQGQVFLAQYAKDKSKELIIFAPPSADLSTAPSGSFSPSENPLSDAIKFITDEKAFVFLLWNDEDMEMLKAINLCVIAGLQIYDLTDGLNRIGSTEHIEVDEPSIPESEQILVSILDTLEEEWEDDEDEDGDDEEEEEDIEEDILSMAYSLIEALTTIVTKKVLATLDEQAKDALKKPSKGSEA